MISEVAECLASTALDTFPYKQNAEAPTMFRFSIRDVLWLTVVAALGVGW